MCQLVSRMVLPPDCFSSLHLRWRVRLRIGLCGIDVVADDVFSSKVSSGSGSRWSSSVDAVYEADIML